MGEIVQWVSHVQPHVSYNPLVPTRKQSLNTDQENDISTDGHGPKMKTQERLPPIPQPWSQAIGENADRQDEFLSKSPPKQNIHRITNFKPKNPKWFLSWILPEVRLKPLCQDIAETAFRTTLSRLSCSPEAAALSPLLSCLQRGLCNFSSLGLPTATSSHFLLPSPPGLSSSSGSLTFQRNFLEGFPPLNDPWVPGSS